MLYAIYSAIKTKLTTMDTTGVLKGIEWYNVQYDSTIATTPRVFVEFPDALDFGQISKDARRTRVKVRLHVVTQAIATADGAVDDTVASSHDTTANSVRGWIEALKITGLSTLHLSAWQHWHKYKGWMVTFVEFTADKQP